MTKFDVAPSSTANSFGTTASPSTPPPSPHTCAYEPHAYPGSVPLASGPATPLTARPVTQWYLTPALS